MRRYLDGAVKDFWRANPQYAPQPDEDGDKELIFADTNMRCLHCG